ncbi:MAG: hypothetical protein ACJ72M_05640 [Propionibacteriaceae bacterium]|jgi:hypothetical protein
MADDVTELVYKGPPAFAGLLAQMLRDEGLSVSYGPPEENTDLENTDLDGPMQLATVVLLVTGPLAPGIWKAIKKFKEWATKRAVPVAVQGPAELEQSTEERLATLDRLLKQGTITEEEHGEQRTRILGEL